MTSTASKTPMVTSAWVLTCIGARTGLMLLTGVVVLEENLGPDKGTALLHVAASSTIRNKAFGFKIVGRSRRSDSFGI